MLAAVAASTIYKAEPMATGYSVVTSGIVMFVTPVVFALYLEILPNVPEIVNPESTADGSLQFLPFHDGTTGWTALGLFLVRLFTARSPALAEFELCRLNWFEAAARLAQFDCLTMESKFVYVPARSVAAGLIIHKYLSAQMKQSARRAAQPERKQSRS